MDKSEPLMTPAQVAELTSLSPNGLAQLRFTGRGPTFLKLGRQIRYRPADVQEWLDASVRVRSDGMVG
jgi:hypothetical protein